MIFLPDGSVVEVSTASSEMHPVTAVSNAEEAELTVEGLFSPGDYVEVLSGWLGLTGRIFRIGHMTPTGFALEGVDTRGRAYPEGKGAGWVRRIGGWERWHATGDDRHIRSFRIRCRQREVLFNGVVCEVQPGTVGAACLFHPVGYDIDPNVGDV